ncbi:hypothetical protein SK128_001795 [Halocaridina rubra]|uniref:Uncharacterized protein n=1 Tax=Halocaridina rubra TaxID=373956 RepID=A0AAN8XIZ6_HALRR
MQVSAVVLLTAAQFTRFYVILLVPQKLKEIITLDILGIIFFRACRESWIPSAQLLSVSSDLLSIAT